MIRDPLYAAIEEGLSKPLDADAFELCAASLLRQLYPTLVPVRGGSDAGMDGYAGQPDAPPIVLAATIGSRCLRNLRNSLQSHLKAGGRARRAVFATCQTLRPRRRFNLEKAATQLGFDLIQIHERAWFVDALYRDPKWRKDLLGIPGEQPALSVIPPSMRPTILLSLVGRERELHALRPGTGDMVVVGKPGIGKTAVLRQLALEGWGLFVVDDSNQRLPDAIREQMPPRIIVDDAHFDPPRLSKLRQLREAVASDFAIVAVTWPGAQVSVESHLASACSVKIGPLTRDQVVRVIEEVGVKGPSHFQREIVDQALGRPGLAATLALLALNGKAREVATGEALLQDTQVTYQRMLGDQSAAVLAVIALSGDSGVDMSTIGTALKLDLASTHTLVKGLASGGTIDEAQSRGGRLIVQPESLRYALVREMFFSSTASLPLETILDAFPDCAVAIVPLVGAAHRGAVLEPSMMRPLLQKASDARAFEAYASLGEEEAKFALSLRPGHALGIGQAALLRTPALGFRILMEQAVGDTRPRHSHPDHPMRILKDYLGAPSGMLEQRQQLLGVVSDWIAGDGDPDIGLEALCHALGPGFETTTSDPGEGRNVTMSSGLLPVESLKEITKLWGEALQLITTIRCQNYVPLLEVLGDWIFPSRVTFSPAAPDEEHGFMGKEAAQFIRQLAKRFRWHRGVTAGLARLARQGKLGVNIRTDREFDLLFPKEEFRRRPHDWEATQARQLDAARRCGGSMRTLPASEAAKRLVTAEREAAEAGITWPRMTVEVCQYLAEHAPKPEEYAEAFRELAASPDLVLPFLSTTVLKKRPGWSKLMSGFLSNERFWRAAAVVCLTQPVGEDLRKDAIRHCDESLVRTLEILVVRGEIDSQTLPDLLDHENPPVARAVAIHLRGTVDKLPTRTRRKWEEAIIRCPADDFWYAEILKPRPSLLVDWVKAWLERQASAGPTYEPIPDSLLRVIADLPVESREELLGCIRPEADSFFVRDLVASLVGDEEHLVAVLFGRPELERYQRTALIGQPTASWLERACLALDHGWSPEEVVAACTGHGWTISGSEAAHWSRWVDDFKKLGRGRGRRAKLLSQAGVQRYSRLRDRAAERERHEAIYGLS